MLAYLTRHFPRQFFEIGPCFASVGLQPLLHQRQHLRSQRGFAGLDFTRFRRLPCRQLFRANMAGDPSAGFLLAGFHIMPQFGDHIVDQWQHLRLDRLVENLFGFFESNRADLVGRHAFGGRRCRNRFRRAGRREIGGIEQHVKPFENRPKGLGYRRLAQHTDSTGRLGFILIGRLVLRGIHSHRN